MRTTLFTKSVAATLRFARHVCGLALVLAACASAAYAGVPPPGTPEIDPSSMGSALALLAGGVLLLRDRLRRK